MSCRSFDNVCFHFRHFFDVFFFLFVCRGHAARKCSAALKEHCVFALLLRVQAYMDKHKYGNTETYDLWNAWSEVSGKDIGQVLDTLDLLSSSGRMTRVCLRTGTKGTVFSERLTNVIRGCNSTRPGKCRALDREQIFRCIPFMV